MIFSAFFKKQIKKKYCWRQYQTDSNEVNVKPKSWWMTSYFKENIILFSCLILFQPDRMTLTFLTKPQPYQENADAYLKCILWTFNW